ncbi:glycoside hydrolase family 16 protein [Mycena olivaceomarginata]|nr:glycoside hydrolase family 16 protein [Mycena olivaceomarginata]
MSSQTRRQKRRLFFRLPPPLLFIADFAAMPASCESGAWSAWWSVGPSWPHMGEIDVLEGVHKTSTNKMTLHTSPSCIVSCEDMAGIPDLTDCQSGGGDTTSYDEGFNNAGGGVYVHVRTKDAIKIWHISRANIPANIIAGKQDPNVGHPQGLVRRRGGNHVLTIDTKTLRSGLLRLCGDWAGHVNGTGCPSDCASIAADPANFNWARWNISYIAVYH